MHPVQFNQVTKRVAIEKANESYKHCGLNILKSLSSRDANNQQQPISANIESLKTSVTESVQIIREARWTKTITWKISGLRFSRRSWWRDSYPQIEPSPFLGCSWFPPFSGVATDWVISICEGKSLRSEQPLDREDGVVGYATGQPSSWIHTRQDSTKSQF